jgi:hypothetical protein
MKVAIEVYEVPEFPTMYFCKHSGILKSDCTIIDEEKVMDKIGVVIEQVTEEWAKQFLKDAYPGEGTNSLENAIENLKKNNWIVKDEIEEALEEFKNYSDNLKRRTYYPKIEEELELIEKCNNVIELLQNKIKELSK